MQVEMVQKSIKYEWNYGAYLVLNLLDEAFDKILK